MRVKPSSKTLHITEVMGEKLTGALVRFACAQTRFCPMHGTGVSSPFPAKIASDDYRVIPRLCAYLKHSQNP